MLDFNRNKVNARHLAKVRLLAQGRNISADLVDLIAVKFQAPQMVETALPVAEKLVELAATHALDAAEIQNIADRLFSEMKAEHSEEEATATMKGILLDRVVEKQDRYSMRAADYRGGGQDVTLSDRIADGVMSRVNPKHTPTIGRDFAHTSMAEIARVVLEHVGRRPQGGAAKAVEMALHTTSDFPEILSNVVNRTMLDGYEQGRSQLMQASREVSATDFRAINSVRVSTGSHLDRVKESGEFTSGMIEEGAESFGLETYGKVFGITRQALVNDDLGVFSNIAPMLGQGAAYTEARLFAGLLEQNGGLGPTMKDGKPLFHLDHGNLGTGAALSITALGAARTAMRRQKGLSGEAINVTPAFLVVPPELETVAEQLIADITAAETSQVNPFAGRLTLLVDANLPDPARWYLAALPGRPDGLQHAYLDDQRGPQVFTQEGFEVDALRFKVRLDFGAGFVDHRPWFMNPGA